MKMHGLGQFNHWKGSAGGGGGGVWVGGEGGWDWWKSQSAIKGEKMKWHLTLLDTGEWRSATEVQSSLGTCGNRGGGGGGGDQVCRVATWGERMG